MSKCKCSLSISLCGDGCRYCQPQEYIDRLHEILEEERAEQAQLEKQRDELLSALKTISESDKCPAIFAQIALDAIKKVE